MVKSSTRFKNAGESLIEILKSLTSSMYILYIPVGCKMEQDMGRRQFSLALQLFTC